mmetsp:Transcript_38641/g.82031  ORF Transcript_38641/g.82031 Transcript_38641/m.82031 type:complete len:302 (-) Transcript_38641:569-1474(-)
MMRKQRWRKAMMRLKTWSTTSYTACRPSSKRCETSASCIHSSLKRSANPWRKQSPRSSENTKSSLLLLGALAAQCVLPSGKIQKAKLWQQQEVKHQHQHHQQLCLLQWPRIPQKSQRSRLLQKLQRVQRPQPTVRTPQEFRETTTPEDQPLKPKMHLTQARERAGPLCCLWMERRRTRCEHAVRSQARPLLYCLQVPCRRKHHRLKQRCRSRSDGRRSVRLSPSRPQPRRSAAQSTEPHLLGSSNRTAAPAPAEEIPWVAPRVQAPPARRSGMQSSASLCFKTSTRTALVWLRLGKLSSTD